MTAADDGLVSLQMLADSEAPKNPAGENAQAFVDVWADEVRRLVSDVRELRQKYDRDSRAMDRNDQWTPLIEQDMYANWRRL